MLAAPDDGLIAHRVLSHYRQIGARPGWNREKVKNLCSLANRTLEEVGAMAGLTPCETRQAYQRDRFTVPVSIHFAIIESALKEIRFGEPAMPVVPMHLFEEKP
jgi:hypothetical protein